MPKLQYTQNSTSIFSVETPKSFICNKCGMRCDYRKVMPFKDQFMYMRELCWCEQEREDQANAERILNITRNNLRYASGIIGELAETQIDQITGKGTDKARAYAHSFINNYPHDRWLVLTGGFGVGKTHIATAIGNELLNKLVSVKFANIADLLDEIKSSYSHEENLNPMTSLINASVIILDDIGAVKITDWSIEQMYTVINSAYMRNRAVVITTNCRSISELTSAVGKRAMDRILHRATWCDIDAPSHRVAEYKRRGGKF